MAKLNIDVAVNGQQKIKELDNQIGLLGATSQQISKAGLAAVVAGVAAIGVAIHKTLSDGFEFNKMIEDQTAGLTALAMTQQTSEDYTTRLTGATNEAKGAMIELQKINSKTPHTLGETNRIYQAMYVSMKNVGASSEEIIGLTQKLSVAAGAANIPVNSLVAGVDSLATGTVMANSDLGRFLGSLGLTNEALKESSDVVQLVNDKLKDFKQLDTIATATSNLSNTWAQLAGQLSKDIFAGSKTGLNEFSDLMSKISDEDIVTLKNGFNEMAIALASASIGIIKVVTGIANGFESLGARVAGAIYRIENGVFLTDTQKRALDAMYQKTKDNIKAREDFVVTLEKSSGAFERAVRKSQMDTQAQKEAGEQTYDLSIKKDVLKESISKVIEITDQEIYKLELLELGLDESGYAIESNKGKIDQHIDSMERYTEATTQASEATLELMKTQNLQSGVGVDIKTHTGRSDSPVLDGATAYALHSGMISYGQATGDYGETGMAKFLKEQQQTNKELRMLNNKVQR